MDRTIKNWTIFGIITVIAISIVLYFSVAVEPYSSAKIQANKIAYKSANLSNPDYFANFSQKKQYFTVGGVNEKNKYRYVIINAKSGKIKIINANSHSREDILSKVKKSYNPKKISHIDLGLVKGKPTWEVLFKNRNKTNGYVMVDYSTGKILQTINNI